MAYNVFREMCSAEGVSLSDIDTLSWVLHRLGIALNYKDDWRLRETSVLKPEWVTNGIYRILNAATVANTHGELHLRDLVSILPSAQYPESTHAFLIHLMRKFSLCFAFPEDTDRYLVPELLGKEEPDSIHEFSAGCCLGFDYHYPIIPEGIIPRFIVRSHALSAGQPRWHSGVILFHEGCRALVQTQPALRRVVIRIKGGDAGARRRLLAIIRYDVDRIHSDFKGLQVQSRVPVPAAAGSAVDYEMLLAFEQCGIARFPEVVDGAVQELSVVDLLNGIDERVPRTRPGQMAAAASVFISYAREDDAFRDQLDVHLKLLQRQGLVATWHDRKIEAGSEWGSEIDRYLEQAKIIIFLVSAPPFGLRRLDIRAKLPSLHTDKERSKRG